MHVNAGQVLWRANDVSDSFYIVINGRLRAITEDDEGVVKIVQSMAKGILLAKLMLSQAPLGVIRCMPFEIQSSFGCRRLFSMPYRRGKVFLGLICSIQLRYVLSYTLEIRRPPPCM